MIIYRCSKCGRWSHAKRKPKSHTRSVWWGEVGRWADEQGVDLPDVGDRYDGLLITSVEGGPEPETGAWVEGFAMVACGPFDSYTAERVES